MEKKNIWIITPKTNLHVGNDNTSSYGLIDLAVQRDAVTELPSINSSSLKGAIKEWASQSKKMERDKLISIFGSDKDKNSTTKKGGNIFFDAQIIAIPVPDDNKMFKLITCQEVLKACVEKAAMLGIEVSKSDLNKGYELKTYEEFKAACSDDNLPIIARNVLDNGISQNLWYEQVVPAESVFFTIIGRLDNQEDRLNGELDNNVVQVGANGSIGYGYCMFKHL